MKKLNTVKHYFVGISALAGFAFLALGPETASAQVYYPQPFYYGAYPDRQVGPYLNLDLGVDIMQRVQTTRFGYATAFTPRTGTRFGFEPGVNFLSTPYLTLAGEFETGVSYNYISSVTPPGAPYPVHGDYYQVPLLGNLILKLKTPSIVEPYIGIGGGGDYSSVSLRDYNYGYHGFRTTSDEIDPAVQGLIGLKFRINPMAEVGIGYKYLATFTGGGNVINTHSIQASFGVRF